MSRSIKFSMEYDAPIDLVWKSLTNKESLSEWLMPCNFEAEVGFEFEFRTKSYPGFDGIIRCKVLELKEKDTLSFSWSGGSLENTIVIFKIRPLPNNRTLMEFEHSGFEGFRNSVIVRRILANGWKKKILSKYLPKYLSK